MWTCFVPWTILYPYSLGGSVNVLNFKVTRHNCFNKRILSRASDYKRLFFFKIIKFIIITKKMYFFLIQFYMILKTEMKTLWKQKRTFLIEYFGQEFIYQELFVWCSPLKTTQSSLKIFENCIICLIKTLRDAKRNK